MKLHVIGSSSSGNCYVLDNGKEALIIECGIAFKKVQAELGFNISRVAGALVSHEHGDHAKHVGKFLEARIPCYMSEGTRDALHLNDHRLVCGMLPGGNPYHVGNFLVQGFETEHDAADPFGFLIYHPECGLTLFATDTYYLAYSFPPLNNILIECNYRLDILEANIASGNLNPALRNRTIKSHMSFDTCKETLLANDLSKVNNIVLIHLSSGNADAAAFRDGIQKATHKNVHVAEPGLEILFNKTPF
jgi:phosphoribosyl 1,2-cyclic phosphodiesterase